MERRPGYGGPGARGQGGGGEGAGRRRGGGREAAGRGQLAGLQNPAEHLTLKLLDFISTVCDPIRSRFHGPGMPTTANAGLGWHRPQLRDMRPDSAWEPRRCTRLRSQPPVASGTAQGPSPLPAPAHPAASCLLPTSHLQPSSVLTVTHENTRGSHHQIHPPTSTTPPSSPWGLDSAAGTQVQHSRSPHS